MLVSYVRILVRPLFRIALAVRVEVRVAGLPVGAVMIGKLTAGRPPFGWMAGRPMPRYGLLYGSDIVYSSSDEQNRKR